MMKNFAPILTMSMLSFTACKSSVSIQAGADASSGSSSGGTKPLGNACALPACSAPEWANWPIPSSPGEGKPNPVSYELSADVATDSVTGLMWQRAAAPDMYTLSTATAYCAASVVAGFSDWRLPWRIELVSIVDDTAAGTGIDATVFPDTPLDYTWTSTPLLNDASAVWAVHFGGYDYYSNAVDISNSAPARCVRGSAAAPSCRYSATEGTVLDIETKLTWQRHVEPGAHTWTNAKAYCDALPLDGGGWRLPSVKELVSIIDLCRTNPAVDPEAFPDTPSDIFWSSTPVAGATSSAWFVYFSEGNADSHDTSIMSLARCVR